MLVAIFCFNGFTCELARKTWNQSASISGSLFGKFSDKSCANSFQVREKSGNFVDDQGNSERTWKVIESQEI